MMNLLIRIACAALLPASLMIAQQTPPAATASARNPAQLRLPIDSLGDGLIPPSLLPNQFSVNVTRKCRHKKDGGLASLVIIDAGGKPHLERETNQQSSGILTGWMRRILAEDRFKPAMRGSQPVAVAQAVSITVETCDVVSRQENGEPLSQTYLHAQPIQRFTASPIDITQAILSADGSVVQISTPEYPVVYFSGSPGNTPPKFAHLAVSQFVNEARRQHIVGNCAVVLIVDATGKPHDIHVVHSSDGRLNASAIEAASNSQFKPATLENHPVASLFYVGFVSGFR